MTIAPPFAAGLQVKTSAECGSCTRCCAGETFCKVIYTNEGSKNAFVGLTPDFPAKVVPVDLGSWGESNLISKSGAYISNIGEVEVNVNFDCGITGCCIRGMGCIRQQSKGSGTVFLEAGGTVLTRTLGQGEKIVVDSDSIVGFQDTVELGWQLNGGPLTWCFGGEGCCNLTVSGPGTVMIQSMSRGRYIQAMAPNPVGGGQEPDGANDKNT